MGVSISLYTIDLRPHPTWDSMPAGARQLTAAGLPSVWSDEDWRADPMLRPADFDFWRCWIRANMENLNMSHWLAMVDLLEAGPEWWVYVSY